MSNQTVQSLEKSLGLIENLALNYPEGANLKDISKDTGLNKTTAFRILSTFVNEGYISKDVAGIYKITSKMFEIGKSAVLNRDLMSVAKPFLDRLSDLTFEAAQLSLIQESCVMTAYSVDNGNNYIKIVPKIGEVYPLYCTSAGKAFLANMSIQQVKKYCSEVTFEKFTKNTIVDVDILLEELKKVKEMGYALEDEEHDVGIRCISAVIRDNENSVVGMVTLAAPKLRMDDGKLEILAHYVINTADKISMNL